MMHAVELVTDEPGRHVSRYRGWEVRVWQEPCLGGWDMTYYTIERLSDGFFGADGFTEDETPLAEQAAGFRERVDAELLEADPFGETSGLIGGLGL